MKAKISEFCQLVERPMITPSDEDYQETKCLKIEGTPLPSPFKELADWIGSRYGVHVLNVRYDVDNFPRLFVILESEEEARKFRRGPFGNFLRAKQDRVRRQFETLVSQQGHRGFAVDRLFVCFIAFEPVARIEANERVSKEEIERLKERLNNEDLWHISPRFESVTFFFYTDAQVTAYEANGLRDSYAQEYAHLVEQYDEFGYLKRHGVSARFDSKENFDTNYQSNWYYYYL